VADLEPIIQEAILNAYQYIEELDKIVTDSIRAASATGDLDEAIKVIDAALVNVSDAAANAHSAINDFGDGAESAAAATEFFNGILADEIDDLHTVRDAFAEAAASAKAETAATIAAAAASAAYAAQLDSVRRAALQDIAANYAMQEATARSDAAYIAGRAALEAYKAAIDDVSRAFLEDAMAAKAASDAVAGATTRQVVSFALWNKASSSLTALNLVLDKIMASPAAKGGQIMAWWRQWSAAIHWVVMGGLEILSTLVPAIVLAGAAIFGMIPTFTHIKDVMTNLVTASGSLGGALKNSVAPLQAMGAASARLRQFLAPAAYIIFGAAINGIASHVGAFTKVTEQAGNVMAQFATKISTALSGSMGAALVGFFADALNEMIQWGQVLGNLGHVFLNIMGAMLGVGKVVLQAFVQITRALVIMTSNPVVAWIIGIVSMFSALYRWGVLVAGMLRFLGFGLLVSGIKAAVAGIGDLVAAFQLAAEAGFTLDATLGALDLLLGPIGWAALAFSVILGGLVLSGLNPTRDATDKLIASQNKLSMTLPNLKSSMTGMEGNLTSLMKAQNGMSDAMAHTVGVSTRLDGNYRGTSQAQNNLTADITKSIGQMTKLANETINLITGLTQAGLRSGALGGALQALQIQTALTDSKIQNVNQALDQYISILTGGTSANANFITSMANIGSVSATTRNNLGTNTVQMSLDAKQFAKALTNMGTVGAAAWQNFDQVLTGSMQPMMDWLRTAGVLGAVTGPQVARVALDMASSMAKYAGSNVTAQQEILGFLAAQGLVFPNFQKFEAAAKKAGASQRDQNKIIDQATIAWSHLSAMAKSASTALSSQVASAVAKSALTVSGFNKALGKLQTDMMNKQPAAVIQADMQAINRDYQDAQKLAAQYGQGIHDASTTASGSVHTASSQMGQYWSNAKGKQKELDSQVGISSSAIGRNTHGAASSTQAAMKSMAAAFDMSKLHAQELQNFINSMHGKTINVTTVFSNTGAPSSAIGSPAPGFGTGGGGSGVGSTGPSTVIHVHGSVVTSQGLARDVQTALNQKTIRNASTQLFISSRRH
jgi:hypothetical protein